MGCTGGSTLTQQLVKNYFLTPERTITRKFKEILLSVVMEFKYGKSVKELSGAEAAVIAGLIKAPNSYSPYHQTERCRRTADLGEAHQRNSATHI